MTKEELQKIQDRIAQLLKLANDPGATESEALAAMDKVHVLCAKYNVELQDVTHSSENTITESIVFNTYKDRWMRNIYTVVSKYYFVSHSFIENVQGIGNQGKPVKGIHHFFVGESHNIEIAKRMSEYLIKTIKKLAKEAFPSVPAYQRDFSKGATNRVVQRLLAQIKEESKPAQEQGYGLVLASLYDKAENDAALYLEQKGVKPKIRKDRTCKVYGHAYSAGQVAGDGIGLHTQIG